MRGIETLKLAVVGSVALDNLETPYGRVRGVLGGSAVHASVAASFFMRGVGLVGVVGWDFPRRFHRLLWARGIELSGLESAPGRTFHWQGRYRGEMAVAETLRTDLGVFADFDPLLPAIHRQARFLFLGNIAPELQARVLSQMLRPRFVMLDTMNYWIASRKAALLRILRRVDAAVINDNEIRQLTGLSSLIQAARALAARGPRWVLLKRGEHGASLVGRREYAHLPAYPTAYVRDPTGAGDAFAGAVMGSLAASGRVDFPSLRRAMACGVVLASFQVEDFSLRRLLCLRKEEISRRLRALKAMSRF